jgi:hypothetical protein
MRQASRMARVVQPFRVHADDRGRFTMLIELVPQGPVEPLDGPSPKVVLSSLTAGRRTPRADRDRGKNVTFTWPAEAADEVRSDCRRLSWRYGSPLTTERAVPQKLTLSALLAGALDQAMEEPHVWLGSVTQDGRSSRARAPADRVKPRAVSKVGVTLPSDIRQRFERFFDDVSDDAEVIWEAGFRPSRSNLALAGVRHALETAEEWLPPLDK